MRALPSWGPNLVARALKDDTHTELLVQTQALARRVAQIEQMLGHALPTLHQRLAGIEQLICSADTNAAQRDALDFARHYNLFSSTRYGSSWELQTIIVHVLEYAMLSHGNSREVAYKFHADCQDASSRGFKRFWNTVEQESPRLMPTHRHCCSHRQSRADLRPAARAAGRHSRSG